MKASEVLSNHSLKGIRCCKGIIEGMMAAEQALSENEIRAQLAENPCVFPDIFVFEKLSDIVGLFFFIDV